MEKIFPNLPTGTPPASREEFVYQVLKESILNRTLRPGDKLVLSKIAENLGVSQIPVRAAIGRLISDGLVTQEAHRPPEVSAFSAEVLEEMLVIRMHLEKLANSEAVICLTPDQVRELRSLVGQMGEALKKAERDDYGALDKVFHLKIYEACPYPLLVRMIKALWDNSNRYLAGSIFSLAPSRAEESYMEHQYILEQIEAGKYDDAVDALAEHNMKARQVFLQSLRSQPEQ